MGSARTSRPLRAALCACLLYGGLLMVVTPEAWATLSMRALALPVLAGRRAGVAGGIAMGGSLAATHLALRCRPPLPLEALCGTGRSWQSPESQARSSCPSNTLRAGPVIEMGSPGASTRIASGPPGRCTCKV
jgi:uncharacterized protein YjeT (DUF2065 family)